jgi:hypothetical protein
MGLLDKIVGDNEQNQEENNKEDALTFENKCIENECNNGREILRKDYPEIYDKLITQMGESRFNDDILYNSEIRNVRKILARNGNYLDDLKEE